MEFHKYIRLEFSEDKRPTPGVLAQEVLGEAGRRLREGDTEAYLRIKGKLRKVYKDEVNPAIEDAMRVGLGTRDLHIPEADRRIEQLFVQHCVRGRVNL